MPSQKYLHKPSLCVWIKKYFIFIKYSNLHSHGKTQKDGCIFKLLPVVAWVEELGGVELREFTSLKIYFWIFLAVQGLRLCAPNARGTGFIPGREIKMPHAMQHIQKKLKKHFFSKIKILRLFFFVFIYVLCIFQIKKCLWREFPGGPVVRTLSFHCRGPRFNPWLGT